MNRIESGSGPTGGWWQPEMARKGVAHELLFVVGLASTIYLVGMASFYTFLTVVFAPTSSHFISHLNLVGMILASSVPALTYAAIGFSGLKFLASSRFWRLGLFATLVEAALAIYAIARPGSIPLFTDWLL